MSQQQLIDGAGVVFDEVAAAPRRRGRPPVSESVRRLREREAYLRTLSVAMQIRLGMDVMINRGDNLNFVAAGRLLLELEKPAPLALAGDTFGWEDRSPAALGLDAPVGPAPL